MSDQFNPTAEEIEQQRILLLEYRVEYDNLSLLAKMHKLKIPHYNPPIDSRFLKILNVPFTTLKNGSVKPLPFWMNRHTFMKYMRPNSDKFQPLITTPEWDALMSSNASDDAIARLIIDRYSDFQYLVSLECAHVYDPIFHKFASKTGYFIAWKTQERLAADWLIILPFVIVKFIKQLRTSYRKTKGGYSTFFQGCFSMILLSYYFNYCRDVHKEDARYNIPAIDKFIKIEPDINPEDCPALSDHTIFDNELYYHILSKLVPLDISL